MIENGQCLLPKPFFVCLSRSSVHSFPGWLSVDSQRASRHRCNHAELQANDPGSCGLGWVIAPDGCCYHLTSRQVIGTPCLLSSGCHGRPLLSRSATLLGLTLVSLVLVLVEVVVDTWGHEVLVRILAVVPSS